MGGKTSKFGSQGPPEFHKNNGDNEKVLRVKRTGDLERGPLIKN